MYFNFSLKSVSMDFARAAKDNELKNGTLSGDEIPDGSGNGGITEDGRLRRQVGVFDRLVYSSCFLI